MTLSFVRRAVAEVMAQKVIRIGRVVMRAKNTVVLNPPPNFHAPHVGTRIKREIKSPFEKVSLPGPSAGSGGLFIAGDLDR